jgi:hypothetical protein
MTLFNLTPARIKRGLPFFLGFLVAFILNGLLTRQLVRYIDSHENPNRWLIYLTIANIFLGFTISIGAVWIWAKGLDEMDRRMHLETMAFAFIGSFGVALFQVMWVVCGGEPLPTVLMPAAMSGLWVIGAAKTARKYR